jgi:hypothetical protein
MSKEQILALLRTAVKDDVIYCLHCDYGTLEARSSLADGNKMMKLLPFE